MGFWESILLALGVCADCFAVSLCSSLKIRKLEWNKLLTTAGVFAIIQTGFLLAGWVFGELFVGLVHTLSHIIAFALLAYVGGSMLFEAIKAMRGDDDHAMDLSSFKKVMLAGVATSIDAAAIGVSQSMIGLKWADMQLLTLAVFIFTFLFVALGMACGKKLGENFGHWAEVVGGCVLLFLAFRSIFL